MIKNDFIAFLDYVKSGDLMSIEQYFDPKYLELQNEYFQKPIHVAAKAGKLEIVKYFHQKRCNLEDRDANGFAPIHYASGGGYLDIVEYLVENGCDVDKRDDYGNRPTHFACQNGHIEIVKFFFQNKFDLEQPNQEFGMRPIDHACKNGHIEIVKFFFQNQLDLQQPDKFGRRPIHFACEKGHIEIVKFFFQNKLDLEQPNEDGMRPIHYACLSGHIEIVKFFFQNNFDLEQPDKFGMRPIHSACLNGHIEIVKFFFQNKLDLEHPNKLGERPIHYAVKRLHIEIVKYFISHHCDMKAETNEGKTPLDMAKNLKNEEMIELLESSIRRLNIIKRMEAESMKSCGVFCNHSFCSKQISQNQSFIKKGGFGSVYKIKDPLTRVDIAVKKFKIAGLSETEYLEKHINDYRDKLFHERIIQYYFAFKKYNKMYIFMECALLGSLHDVIQKKGPLEHSTIIRYSQQILDGLKFLHENHYIHRDVKPKNILMFPNDCVKLCDFGLSRVIETISNNRGNGGACSAIGTANYVAPELVNGDRYDYSVDIWSLGASMIEMLTGKAPYSHLDHHAVIFKIGTEKLIKFEPYQPMSAEFTKFHSSMLEIDPVKRPTASKLLTEIKNLLKNEPK